MLPFSSDAIPIETFPAAILTLLTRSIDFELLAAVRTLSSAALDHPLAVSPRNHGSAVTEGDRKSVV